MAVVMAAEVTALGPAAVSTFRVSLTEGWDPWPGRPLAAGDLVMLFVRKPDVIAEGPAGWARHGNGFVKVIGDPAAETEPVFSGHAPDGWRVEGRAYGAGSFTLPETAPAISRDPSACSRNSHGGEASRTGDPSGATSHTAVLPDGVKPGPESSSSGPQ